MKVDEMIPEQVEKLIEQREAVRKMRNYAEADKIRLDIEKLGYRLEDKGGRTRAIKIWLVDTACCVNFFVVWWVYRTARAGRY